MRRQPRRAWLGVALMAALGGCVVGPSFVRPPPPLVDYYTRAPLPEETAAAGGAQRFVTGASVQSRWWTLLGSPKLDEMEDAAIKANPNLAAAKAALRQAHETYVAQRAALFPAVEFAASATRAKNSVTIAPPLNSNAEIYSLYTAQLNVSYVVDVFGGERRSVESAAATAEAQAYETDVVYLTLTANVASAALQLASLNDQTEATRRLIEADRAILRIMESQRARGEASDADVAAARATLEQAEQLAPALRKQVDLQFDLLAGLLGRAPSAGPAERLSMTDFTLPRDLPVSLPATLVRQRPDVRAAEANVHAASALVGVALAARLPSITLAGSAGGASENIASLLSDSNTLWSIAGSVGQTVFDAGALRHKQRAAEAGLDQAMALYRAAVLTGLQNTADTLQAIVDDAETAKHADASAGATAESLRIARAQFAQGQSSVLPALNAEGADSLTRIAMIQALTARYTDTVALYQALGGGWRPAD